MKKRKKARFNFGVRNGSRSGYSDYRYGVSAPVSLASPQLTTPKILRGMARKEVLERTVEGMREWTKTPFENEGAVRAGLRVGLVLRGNGWEGSDATAAEIVAEALDLMGATRPSHEEGQPGYSLGSDYCHWCCQPIDEGDRSRGRRFCSAHCAKVAVERMSRKTDSRFGMVLRSAQRLLDAERAEPQTCEYCQESFQSDRKARFCGLSCSGLAQAGDQVLLPIQCGMCERTFKPRSQKQRHCSQSCGQKANRQIEARGLAGVRLTCAECDASFQPTQKRAKFCSKACTTKSAARTFRERHRRAKQPPIALCSWCGDEYRPTIAIRAGVEGNCSRKCGFEKSRVGKGARLRDLTRRTFDHYVALPIDDRWRRRLSPQKLDWFFMEMGRPLTGEVDVQMTARTAVTDRLFADA